MDMGWVNPWVGLGWVGSSYENWRPVLSQVARRVLAISASSVQSERDFSCLGYTLTDLRTRLSANKVEAVELLRWACEPACRRTCNCVDDVVWVLMAINDVCCYSFTVFLMEQYNAIILILIDIYTVYLIISSNLG